MGDKRKMKHTPEEIKYRLSDLGVQIGNIAIEYITELEEENANLKDVIEGYKKIAKWCDKCELEKKISILLSCKNCPENKGGLICQKEYEDKCLAQKIQYIKELQEEQKKWKDEWQEKVQEATDEGYARTLQTMKLTKAKELLKKWVELSKPKLEGYPITPIQEQTEQFLSEVEK